MEKVKLDSFNIIGISVRTSNENGQAATDIGTLWGKFMAEGILDKIPNKINNAVYSIYTNYEGDHTQPYTTILGCRVENLDTIPDGMIGQIFQGGDYAKIIAKGDITQGLIYKEWTKIWNLEFDRAYTADFEVYGEKAQNPTDAEVEIFVAL